MQKAATLFERIKNAAKREKNVIYLDTNAVGKMSAIVSERHRLENDLEEILSHETTTTETKQIMTDKAKSIEMCLYLLKQHGNIRLIPEVIEELERGLKIVEDIRDSIRIPKKVCQSKSEKKEIAQKLYKTLEKLIDFAQENNCPTNLTQTEKFQETYRELNRKSPLDRSCADKPSREKYGTRLGTDNKLIAAAITAVTENRYSVVYIVSTDQNLLKRAESLTQDLSYFDKPRLRMIVP